MNHLPLLAFAIALGVSFKEDPLTRNLPIDRPPVSEMLKLKAISYNLIFHTLYASSKLNAIP